MISMSERDNFSWVQLLMHQSSYKSLSRSEMYNVVLVDGNAMPGERDYMGRESSVGSGTFCGGVIFAQSWIGQ